MGLVVGNLVKLREIVSLFLNAAMFFLPAVCSQFMKFNKIILTVFLIDSVVISSSEISKPSQKAESCFSYLWLMLNCQGVLYFPTY